MKTLRDIVQAAQLVRKSVGDFVLARTGQRGQHLKSGIWGQFAAGDAPGLEFETVTWLHDKEVTGICSDTWGKERTSF
jgi:kynurenine formamidase